MCPSLSLHSHTGFGLTLVMKSHAAMMTRFEINANSWHSIYSTRYRKRISGDFVRQNDKRSKNEPLQCPTFCSPPYTYILTT